MYVTCMVFISERERVEQYGNVSSDSGLQWFTVHNFSILHTAKMELKKVKTKKKEKKEILVSGYKKRNNLDKQVLDKKNDLILRNYI